MILNERFDTPMFELATYFIKRSKKIENVILSSSYYDVVIIATYDTSKGINRG